VRVSSAQCRLDIAYSGRCELQKTEILSVLGNGRRERPGHVRWNGGLYGSRTPDHQLPELGCGYLIRAFPQLFQNGMQTVDEVIAIRHNTHSSHYSLHEDVLRAYSLLWVAIVFSCY